MKYTLKPHQKRAYQNITQHLPNKDRLQYISACGTGKTLVGFNLIQDLLQDKDKTIVLFFPSLALIKQTYEAYLEYGLNKEDLYILFVCSDETVYCGADEECIEISKDEVPFQVTTDTEQISLFLESNFKSKIIFSTYHSSKMLSEGFSKAKETVDFALYDEAHKTASNNDSYYNYSLDDDNLKINKRLFMTATPKHKNILDKDNDELLFSMNNPTRYGDVVEQYSVRKAIDDGVVAPYKIIVSIVDEDEVEQIRAKNTSDVLKNMDLKKAAKIIALSKSVEKYNIKKGLVFAERIIRSKEYAMAYDELMAGFNAHLDSKNSTQEIYGAFEHLKESSKAMLFNATLLSEGIDVPSVDLVAFMEKTESSINIAQRIGRATRLDSKNPEKIGYVFIPIFLSSPDEDIFDAALKSGDFNEMLEIINVMAEQDEILYSVFSSSKKDPEESKRILKKFIEINDFTNRFNISQREYLREKIESITLDKISSSWDKNYELFKEYVNEFGELPNENRNAYFNLGGWLQHQKRMYAKNKLSQNRIDLLDKISANWKENHNEIRWNKNYELLKEYYGEFEELPTKSTLYSDFKLGIWLGTQKAFFAKNTLYNNKIEMLDAIDPAWKMSKHELAWNKNYELLKEYYGEFGELPTKSTIYKDIQIGTYLANQKSSYIKGILSEERIKLLDAIDPAWKLDKHEVTWNSNYELLKEYVNEFGELPKDETEYKDNKLGKWVMKQRTYFKKGHLSKERIDKLNFFEDWSISRKDINDKRWVKMFFLLNEYLDKNTNKSLNSGTIYKNIKLGSWIQHQRKRYLSNKLEKNKVDMLVELLGLTKQNDLAYGHDSYLWEYKFSVFNKYLKTFHKPPVNTTEYEKINIGSWWKLQQKKYRKNKLLDYQKEMIDTLNIEI